MEDVQSPKGGGQQSGKALGDTSPSTNTKKRLSDRPATADDLLDWLLEILTLNGSIGMSGEWDQKSFTGALAMEVDEDGHLSGGLPDDTSLTAALGRLICDWSREKYLVDLTDQHKALYPEALRRVDAKLRAGGVSEVMIAKMKPGGKLIKYASVISGRLGAVDRFPKPRHFFVYVMSTKDPTGHIKDYRQLWFPKNVHFGHFMGVLRDMTAYAAERTGHDGGGYMLCDGPWYYNLLGPDKKIFLDAPRQEIVDEESFEVMLLQVRNKDTPGITIFHSLSFKLFKESISRSSKYSSDTFRHRTGDVEDIDEDGEPYFKDNIDWKQIIRGGHRYFDGFLERPAEPGTEVGAANGVGNGVGDGEDGTGNA